MRLRRKGVVSITWGGITKEVLLEGWWGREGGGGRRGHAGEPVGQDAATRTWGLVRPQRRSSHWVPGNSGPWGPAKTLGLRPVNQCPQHPPFTVQDSKFQTGARQASGGGSEGWSQRGGPLGSSSYWPEEGLPGYLGVGVGSLSLQTGGLWVPYWSKMRQIDFYNSI